MDHIQCTVYGAFTQKKKNLIFNLWKKSHLAISVQTRRNQTIIFFYFGLAQMQSHFVALGIISVGYDNSVLTKLLIREHGAMAITHWDKETLSVRLSDRL